MRQKNRQLGELVLIHLPWQRARAGAGAGKGTRPVPFFAWSSCVRAVGEDASVAFPIFFVSLLSGKADVWAKSFGASTSLLAAAASVALPNFFVSC